MTSYKKRMSIPGHFNKLQLIKLVRARPALWDKTEETYRHKFMKREAWHEICRIMKKDYDKLSGTERQKYCRWLIQIWRHTRDSWGRSLNARKKSIKLYGTTVRPYKYDEEMAFLLKVKGPTKSTAAEGGDTEGEDEEEEENEEGAQTEEKNEDSDSDSVPVCENDNEFNDGNNDNESNDDNTDDDWNIDSKEGIVTALSQDKTVEVTVERKDNKITEDFIDAKMRTFRNQMQKIKKTKDVEEDRHFYFFNSLRPSLTLLDDGQILEFQSGVINIIRNIKRGGGFRYVSSVQPSSSWNRGYYMQPGAPAVSEQPVIVPNMVQNISSGSAEASRTQLRVVQDPLKTEKL